MDSKHSESLSVKVRLEWRAGTWWPGLLTRYCLLPSCWLNYKDGFLWSFVGPLAFIIFVSALWGLET